MVTGTLRAVAVAVGIAVFAASPARSESRLALGRVQTRLGGVAEVPLTLSTTEEVQGLVAAFEWDEAGGVGEDLVVGQLLADADVVVRRIQPAYMVLGCVIDDDGIGASRIGPGEDLLVATARILCGGSLGQETSMRFADLEYSTVEGGPLLENLVVVGGRGVAAADGLVLEPGGFGCADVVTRLHLDGSHGNAARVLLDSALPVEGYSLAICHDPAALALLAIEVGAAAVEQDADFTDADLFPGGGTLGVVIDLMAPYTGNAIPAGEARHLASYRYACLGAAPGGAPVELRFCDGILGDPLKDNIVVSGGLANAPLTEDGTLVCEAPPPEDCCDGVDNDQDGLVDLEDPDCASDPCGSVLYRFTCGSRGLGEGGLPSTPRASVGETAEVCFHLLNPEDEAVGQIQQYDHVQGLSMAVAYPCELVAEEELDIAGTIVEAIGADYVAVQVDNDAGDGDGCELVIGILVDALPPFDLTTIPPFDAYQVMGCVRFQVQDDARLCGSCLAIEFQDGVNGRGKVPIRNLVAAENESFRPHTRDCELCVVNRERFFRGDCNFSARSGSDGSRAVDIADAASVVSALFLPPPYRFQPPCLDACDCNDDGRMDLADAVCILRYLFQFGAFPPAPGPGYRETGLPNPNAVAPTGAGVDPTDDLLGCVEGTDC